LRLAAARTSFCAELSAAVRNMLEKRPERLAAADFDRLGRPFNAIWQAHHLAAPFASGFGNHINGRAGRRATAATASG